jgi:hypothetical protein
MRLNTIALTAAISIASTIAAFAHHGWAGNVDEVTAMTGTVTEGVKLAGPHGTMKIKASDGKVWNITLAPPARTASANVATPIVHGNFVFVKRLPRLDRCPHQRRRGRRRPTRTPQA